MATDTKRYSQSRLIFGDTVIICDGFKTSFKKDSKALTCTESSNPYDNTIGKETIEWEASDIDPALRKTLKKYYDEELKVTLASYDFDESTGALVEDDVLYGAFIKELSKENGNDPFSVKGEARASKKQK